MLEELPIWCRIALVFALAAFSGVVEYIQQFRDTEKRKLFSWITLLICSLTAGLAGLLTFWLINKHIDDEGWRAFLIAIAGWGGPRTFELFWSEVFSGMLKKIAAAKTLNDPEQGSDTVRR